MDVQSWAAVIFIIALTVFLYSKRDKLIVQKILFPLLYFVMYKTQLGVKSMDKWAKKYQNFILKISSFIILIGFLGMALIVFELSRSLYKILTSPESMPGVGIVQPFFPNAPGTIFVPFFYFIISIFVIAVVHEFSHGLLARAYKIKVKSSGFAFLGIIFPIIPAAFVEPDEKELAKRPAKHQLALFAAGPFANITLAFLILGFFVVAITPLSQVMMETEGIQILSLAKDNNKTYPAEIAGITPGELILEMDNIPMDSSKNFTQVLDAHKPNDTISVVTNVSTYSVTFTAHPDKPDTPYFGVTVSPKTRVKDDFIATYGSTIPKVLVWFIGLFYWLFLLNLGIGLFNLVPLGPIDGGRMLKTALLHFFKEDKATRIFVFVSVVTFGTIFLNIALAIWR